MTYIVYVSTLTGLIVLRELIHNHVCETVNVLTGLMHTMYICDNMYIYMVQIQYQIQREGRQLRLGIVS